MLLPLLLLLCCSFCNFRFCADLLLLLVLILLLCCCIYFFAVVFDAFNAVLLLFLLCAAAFTYLLPPLGALIDVRVIGNWFVYVVKTR